MSRDDVGNQLLASLPDNEWDALRREAEHIALPAGTTLAHPGEQIYPVYFPTSGVVSVVHGFPAGQHVEVAPVGSDGVIGLGVILKMPASPYWYMVQLDSTGFRMSADAFARAFSTWPGLRGTVLAYIGRALMQAHRAVACNRFHTHDQRLARWLLILAGKSGRQSLELTHEMIAQMVGGPRHAVTSSLHALRECGAIAYSRGQIEIRSESRLAANACECYLPG